MGSEHEHSDGEHEHHHHVLFDDSIKRSRAGLKAIGTSLALLAVTAVIQALVFVVTDSVALLADLIHNGGDAMTAVPLAIAFIMRSSKAEYRSGMFVVALIFVSALVALIAAVDKLIDPEPPEQLLALALSGLIGAAGNWLVARIRSTAGWRLNSPALAADGRHALADAYVSLGVVVGAGGVALGLAWVDPAVALLITAVILKLTWEAWIDLREEASERGV